MSKTRVRDNSVPSINKALSSLDKKVAYVQSSSGGEGGGGGEVTIPATAYASNSEAVAALGVGVLYKSTTLINNSPIILITV